MKELELHQQISNTHNIELTVKKKQEIERMLEGKIKPRKSHFVWELNEETGEIRKAEFKRTTAVAFHATLPTYELVVKLDCVYIPALNAENAKKKYLKDNKQSSYYHIENENNITDLNFKL
jgi:hypothetical protein